MTSTLNHETMNALGSDSTPVTHRHYETYGDFIDSILEADDDGRMGWGNESSSNQSSKDWTLGANYADAIDMGINGWSKGAKMMEDKMSDAVNSHSIPELRNEWANDDWGFILDVGAYLAGDELCALRPAEREHLTNNIVKIRVSLACSAVVDGDQKANWGVAVAFLIDSLEKQGKSVAIEACYLTSGHYGSRHNGEEVGKNYFTTITLKRSGEPLDLDRIAYVIAHPAAHRRLIFRTRELEKSLSGGYGLPRELPKSTEPHVVHIDGVQFNQDAARSVDAAIAKVFKTYNAQVEELDAVQS